MTDFLTKEERSKLMSRVRGRGNLSTELRLVALFRQRGMAGWRRNYTLLGRPDFVFPKLRLVVFVDGCFWHGCPKHFSEPKTNRAFWKEKIVRNRARDLLVTRDLKKRGWHVLRIWHHELKRKNENRCLGRIERALERATVKAKARTKRLPRSEFAEMATKAMRQAQREAARENARYGMPLIVRKYPGRRQRPAPNGGSSANKN
jgi:DNA mismatch endonuclease (patch repair protein)